MTTKECSKCGVEKSIEEFNKNKAAKDGLSNHCKSCLIIERQEYKKRWSENREIITEKKCSRCGLIKPVEMFDKTNYTKTGYVPECKDCKFQHHKDTYESRREYIQQYSKEYNSKCKNKLQTYRKQYYKKEISRFKRYWEIYRENNRELMYERNRRYLKSPHGRASSCRGRHRRRDRSKQTESTLTNEQWEIILKNQKHRCAMCGKRFCKSRPPTRDHIIPVSKGGGLTFENVQALCASCNSIKHANLDLSLIISYGIYN